GLGASLTVRGGEEAPFTTDNGNLVLDLTFENGIADPAATGRSLKTTIGVVETGLFVGMTDTCIVAGPDGPRMLGGRKP
ncbi:MAG: ribose-5-phosphate isomerase A, partial [Chloroflexi bacterium]